MTEVDHDAIAKQLVEAQLAGNLQTVTERLRHVISEPTILALSPLLMSAVSTNLAKAEEIYDLQTQVALLINSNRANGYLKCQLAFMKTSAGDHEGALKIFESVRINYIEYFEDFYTLSLYANIVSLYVFPWKTRRS